ncbi:4-alpha-glucanotransferase, partial [Escherichia coli]|nr:4-alpha-glucanotransferase [Escherichia coli]
LGTFEPWVQDVLQDKGILGTTVLWFESYDDGSPLHTWDYRRLALSAVGTHDLPPTAGYLRFAHNILRDELGLIEEPLEELNEQDHQWQARVLDRVREDGH